MCEEHTNGNLCIVFAVTRWGNTGSVLRASIVWDAGNSTVTVLYCLARLHTQVISVAAYAFTKLTAGICIILNIWKAYKFFVCIVWSHNSRVLDKQDLGSKGPAWAVADPAQA